MVGSSTWSSASRALSCLAASSCCGSTSRRGSQTLRSSSCCRTSREGRARSWRQRSREDLGSGAGSREREGGG
eukprot:4190901-Pleurochrysis_carterae.AAC.1